VWSLISANVLLSVHLSRECIVSRQLKISSNFFLGLVTHHFSFVDPKCRYPGNLFSGALNTLGVGQIVILYWNHHWSRKRYKISPWLLCNVNRKSVGGGSMRVGSYDLEWPWKAHARGQIFQAISLITLDRWPRTTKFGRITQVGEGVSLGVSHASTARGRGTSAPLKTTYSLNFILIVWDVTRCDCFDGWMSWVYSVGWGSIVSPNVNERQYSAGSLYAPCNYCSLCTSFVFVASLADFTLLVRKHAMS